jgi:hypothetical protein
MKPFSNKSVILILWAIFVMIPPAISQNGSCENDTEPPTLILPESVILSCADAFNFEFDTFFFLSEEGISYSVDDNCSSPDDIQIQVAFIDTLDAMECNSEFIGIYYFEVYDESLNLSPPVSMQVEFRDFNAPHFGSFSLEFNGTTYSGFLGLDFSSGDCDNMTCDEYHVFEFTLDDPNDIGDIIEISDDEIGIDVGDDCPNDINDYLSSITYNVNEVNPHIALNYSYCDGCGNCDGFIIRIYIPENSGCTDINACNYLPWATDDDGSCSYNDADNNGICDDVQGCTDPNALNYNPNAEGDDGTCQYEVVISPLELNCAGQSELVLQVTYAENIETAGGLASSETRTIYAHVFDTPGGDPTYTGTARPYVKAPYGFVIEDAAITASISTNDENILLINGYPAYQYSSDDSSMPSQNEDYTHPFFLADGALMQDPCPNEMPVAGWIVLPENCLPFNVEISAYIAGTDLLIDRVSAAPDEDGVFMSYLDLVEGSYDIYLKPEAFLSEGFLDKYQSVFNDPFDEFSFLIMEQVRKGDVNGDDVINFFDASGLGPFFGSSAGNPNYSLGGDINCDGIINFFDGSALGVHFGESGAEP